MKEEGKLKYLAKNTLLFTISSFGSKILVFLLVPLYTSILSTADYGIADLITTSATLLGFFFTINIADSVLRFAIDQKNNQIKYLSYGLKVMTVGSGILGGGLLALSRTSLIDWNSYCYLFLFLHFLGLNLYQIVNNYLRAIDKVKEVAISGIITTLVTVILNVILLLVVKIGIMGYLVSMVSGNFAAAIYCFLCIGEKPLAILKSKCDSKTRKAMVAYSVPLIFNGVAWWMNNSIDKYFVTAIMGVAWNGIYSVSYKIPTILTVFHSIFSQAWNLSAIKEFDKNDVDGFFSKTYTFYNASIVMLCSALILINIPLAKILFAKDFFVAWKYSSVLLISIVFSSMAGFLGSIFTAVKDSRIFAVSTVISAVTNCILNAIFIPAWGVQGAAVATGISFYLIWLIRLICTRKYIKWHINIIRDTFAYLILVAQVIFEHLNGHLYIGQAACFVIVAIIYRKQFSSMISTVFSKL